MTIEHSKVRIKKPAPSVLKDSPDLSTDKRIALTKEAMTETLDKAVPSNRDLVTLTPGFIGTKTDTQRSLARTACAMVT